MIQFISHFNNRFDYVDGVRMALEGGCRWIQLRMKDALDEDFVRVAEKVSPMIRKYGAKFILDDRVHLVRQLGADGVHLGHNDMSPDEARVILGRESIIGGTANTLDDIVNLHEKGVDYIGCGPFRFTTTKKKLAPVIGLEGYREILSGMSRRGINLPLVAIGGITADDVCDVMRTGVSGIALSGAVLTADNPAEEMKKIIKLTTEYGK